MVRRTRAEADATRESLLDAAEQVFLERGVSSTTLEQIAKRANVTRGAIYWHFKNKSDLFRAMLERVRLPLAEIAEGLRQDGRDRDPLGMLQDICRLALAKLDENETYRNVYSILLTRCEFTGEINPVFQQQLSIDDENLRKFENDIREAGARGELRPGIEPRIATLALYSLMHGIYASWLRQPSRFAIREEGEAMLELFFSGLRIEHSRP
ncbi:MAG: TetR family transcriptional regulator [Gammaproteobacteria bacterium]